MLGALGALGAAALSLEVLGAAALVLVLVGVLFVAPLFEPPEYASAYQPLPRRMKFPEVISREAASALQAGQVRIASSVMR